MQQTQILVIGSGVAGLSFALKAAHHYKVTIVTKAEAFSGNTLYAQGGIACVWNEKDSAENHIHDTLIAGAGHCKTEAVEILVREAPQAIQNLINLAVPFCKDANTLHLGREGGHSHNRIVHVKDFTGKALMETLLQKVKTHSNITILEHHTVLELLTENDQCYGAEIIENVNRKTDIILADYTVLCTGGAGQAFAYTTNTENASGDGIVLAYNAGAKLKDLEFVQFHPTTLYHDGAKGFLISEALRGAGAILVNKLGKSFMEKYHWQASLAPRDIVSRAIFSEMQKHKTNCVYLDARHIGEVNLKHEFPQIFNKCQDLGIDISKELIPVIPSAHYMCGGVETDTNGKTSIENLYALGEVACSGVHGANRLASNSLLEGLVFANRAFTHVHLQYYSRLNNSISREREKCNCAIVNSDYDYKLLQECKEIKIKVQQIMWNCFGIVRNRKQMMKGYRDLQKYSFVKLLVKRNKSNPEIHQTYNIWQVAVLIADAALSRKKSLGAHYISTRGNHKSRQANLLQFHI